MDKEGFGLKCLLRCLECQGLFGAPVPCLLLVQEGVQGGKFGRKIWKKLGIVVDKPQE